MTSQDQKKYLYVGRPREIDRTVAAAVASRGTLCRLRRIVKDLIGPSRIVVVAGAFPASAQPSIGQVQHFVARDLGHQVHDANATAMPRRSEADLGGGGAGNAVAAVLCH